MARYSVGAYTYEATLRPCAYSLAAEYDVRAVRCPQTGQWVLIGYMGVLQ